MPPYLEGSTMGIEQRRATYYVPPTHNDNCINDSLTLHDFEYAISCPFLTIVVEPAFKLKIIRTAEARRAGFQNHAPPCSDFMSCRLGAMSNVLLVVNASFSLLNCGGTIYVSYENGASVAYLLRDGNGFGRRTSGFDK
jgi:hypothetical protein